MENDKKPSKEELKEIEELVDLKYSTEESIRKADKILEKIEQIQSEMSKKDEKKGSE